MASLVRLLPAFAIVLASAQNSGRQIATLANTKINESSGIVASRRNPGVYWTHNDSGDGPFLYAFDRTGKDLGTWTLDGAGAYDWEDIAAGPCAHKRGNCLYVGDIGDNMRRRKFITVYRVEEPAVSSGAHHLSDVQAFHFRYPDGSHDAEALLVHPATGDVYIVTKARGADTVTGVYRAKAPLTVNSSTVLVRIAELHFPDESDVTLLLGRVTGGDISPDGRSLVLCDYFHGYELTLSGEGDFDRIWRQPMRVLDLGKRKQGEGICYRLDGKAVLATSEGLPCPLIETVIR